MDAHTAIANRFGMQLLDDSPLTKLGGPVNALCELRSGCKGVVYSLQRGTGPVADLFREQALAVLRHTIELIETYDDQVAAHRSIPDARPTCQS